MSGGLLADSDGVFMSFGSSSKPPPRPGMAATVSLRKLEIVASPLARVLNVLPVGVDIARSFCSKSTW